MKNAKNIRYAIMNLKGFILDKDTGRTLLYHSSEYAVTHMKSGDQIVPIHTDEELDDYESGKIRMPSVNRFGRS